MIHFLEEVMNILYRSLLEVTSHTFLEIDHEIISAVISSLSLIHSRLAIH